MSGGVRVSIPNNVRKMVQDIKEIAGNHTDEEIYAMLKECSMDPNETAQKLLLQDPFHEVKRKRDRRKENPSNREPVETTRWRPGVQGRGGRGARGSYCSRYISYDAGSGRNANTGKDNEVNQSTGRDLTSTSSSSCRTQKIMQPLQHEFSTVNVFRTTISRGAVHLSFGSASFLDSCTKMSWLKVWMA
ncbi:GBF-interacting protein 1-like isoform X2 [Magnolia sinica]|uniref:GBF-interacting protein 1-like isoform X2 n=1 Tax=Magnolia sinica TaxID=86752 RepID=UPI00265939F3|nr:GBF-interacting protein 1-like isoform X2 [Magnolia sinica]